MNDSKRDRFALPFSLPRILAFAALATLSIGLAGCPDDSVEPDDDDPSGAAVPLRVAVIDDASLAAAINRRRGEWQALSGGALEVVELPHDMLDGAEPIDADLIVYPSRFLGTLATAKRIVPVRRATLEGESYAAGDLLPFLRKYEVIWGDEVLAVPFGSPPVVLFYRTDLLAALGKSPPTTWAEYAELVAQFQERPAGVTSSAWFATAELNGKSWAGRMLIARAASYARHVDNYSTLFSIDTMEPLIAGPPFVRALTEYVAAMQGNVAPDVDSNRARKLIYEGSVPLAITWPSAAADIDVDNPPPVAIAPLPGSHEIYDLQSASWEPTADGRLQQSSLFDCRGRLGSVTASSRNAPAALRLLAWLASPDVSKQLASTSLATTLFRQSHVKSASQFAERQLPPEAAGAYAAIIADANVVHPALRIPRIPGVDEYLAALDGACRKALLGQLAPQAALDEASAAWSEITERRGKKAQLAAYRQSLGLSP